MEEAHHQTVRQQLTRQLLRSFHHNPLSSNNVDRPQIGQLFESCTQDRIMMLVEISDEEYTFWGGDSIFVGVPASIIDYYITHGQLKQIQLV